MQHKPPPAALWPALEAVLAQAVGLRPAFVQWVPRWEGRLLVTREGEFWRTDVPGEPLVRTLVRVDNERHFPVVVVKRRRVNAALVVAELFVAQKKIPRNHFVWAKDGDCENVQADNLAVLPYNVLAPAAQAKVRRPVLIKAPKKNACWRRCRSLREASGTINASVARVRAACVAQEAGQTKATANGWRCRFGAVETTPRQTALRNTPVTVYYQDGAERRFSSVYEAANRTKVNADQILQALEGEDKQARLIGGYGFDRPEAQA